MRAKARNKIRILIPPNGDALTDEYPYKKLKAYVDMLTVGEGAENVQHILIAEDALNIKDANRHSVRNRARRTG